MKEQERVQELLKDKEKELKEAYMEIGRLQERIVALEKETRVKVITVPEPYPVYPYYPRPWWVYPYDWPGLGIYPNTGDIDGYPHELLWSESGSEQPEISSIPATDTVTISPGKENPAVSGEQVHSPTKYGGTTYVPSVFSNTSKTTIDDLKFIYQIPDTTYYPKGTLGRKENVRTSRQ